MNYKFHRNHRGKVSVCQIEEDKTGMKGIICSSFSEGIRSAFLVVTERKDWNGVTEHTDIALLMYVYTQLPYTAAQDANV